MDQDSPKYPHNILEGFGLGAMLDLRVRMAFNILQQAPLMAEVTRATLANLPPDQVSEAPRWIAKFALALTDEVLKVGAENGWVAPLPEPEDIGISDQLRAQASRTATYQVVQQIEGQKAGARE